ncbi:MAG: helix-turn-helix transcriptional regulator [Verrucomicrobia bacterium]|nr:helix-turn-helix transcriptional regulator [Verrucomicrobiota bacterium]
MSRLSCSDHRRIAAFARALYGLSSVRAIAQQVVHGIDALIGCNSALVVHNDRRVTSYDLWAENLGPDLHKLLPTYWALRHEHPGIKHLRAYATRAVALSDLLPVYEWRQTASYHEVYSKLGMHEQLAATFPFAQPDLAGVILNRSRRTFTSRDRWALNLLRFHISEACRTARLVEANPAVAIAEAFAPLVEGGAVVLDPTGAVLYASAQARRHLKAFYAAEKPFRGGLPAALGRWVRPELVTLSTDGLAVRPLRALSVTRGEARLEVRLSSAPGGVAHVLILRAEGPAYEVEKLGPLGLGPRATEALYWATQGKTNEEIGIILGMATATVKTHLKAVFARLGIENRASAAAAVSDFLLRPNAANETTVEPCRHSRRINTPPAT